MSGGWRIETQQNTLTTFLGFIQTFFIRSRLELVSVQLIVCKINKTQCDNQDKTNGSTSTLGTHQLDLAEDLKSQTISSEELR